MKLRCLVIVLALLAAFASDSWGQSKEGPPQAKTEQKANETPASQPNTKTQDSKIEIAPMAAPSPSSDHGDNKPGTEASQNSKEDAEGTEYWVYRGYKVKITDGLLVLFTLGLVIIGARQAIFLRGTLAATATAANAAIKSVKLAENSLLVANRPVITIEPLVLSSPTEFLSATHILFGLKNSGHGAAVINRLDANIETSVPGALTLRTTSGLIGSEINGTIEPHQTMSDLRLPSEVLTVDVLPKIFAGNVTLAVTIQITAHDIIDNPYTPTFAFVYDHRGRAFVRRSLTPEQNPRTNS